MRERNRHSAQLRWLAAIGGVACVIASCKGEAENQSQGSSASGGQGGSGRDGYAANGGYGGNVCSQGTFSIYARISGTGFGYADGTAVRATFGDNAEGALDATTSLQRGEFQVSFDSPSNTCNLGASRDEPIVLYIDVDGNGACDLATDEVFVTWAGGGPSGHVTEVTLSPSADHCAPSPVYLSTQVDTVRRLCPEVGFCLPFCGRPGARDPFAGAGPACSAPSDAGAEDESTAPDAAAGDADTLP